MNFINNLKSYLDQNEITLNQFAKKIKVPVSTVHGWLNGAEPKSIHDFKKVALLLGITVDELCFGEAHENLKTDLKIVIGERTYKVLLTRLKDN
jgi:transcriptional regulator with XRE-family HTH domain